MLPLEGDYHFVLEWQESWIVVQITHSWAGDLYPHAFSLIVALTAECQLDVIAGFDQMFVKDAWYVERSRMPAIMCFAIQEVIWWSFHECFLVTMPYDTTVVSRCQACSVIQLTGIRFDVEGQLNEQSLIFGHLDGGAEDADHR